jgi:hypothetical protein
MDSPMFGDRNIWGCTCTCTYGYTILFALEQAGERGKAKQKNDGKGKNSIATWRSLNSIIYCE